MGKKLVFGAFGGKSRARDSEAAPKQGARWADRPKPVVRQVRVGFQETLPRHWFLGSVLGTHMTNGLNLLFPAGEAFFIRSVRRYIDRIDDDELLAQVKAFAGQEGAHAREHRRYFEILEAQGFDVDPILKRFEWLAFELLEPRVGPEYRLAITTACEHFTATFAKNAFESGDHDLMPEEMAELFRWHAAEEIEHKAVAFDVLQVVDPRWTTRAFGMVGASLCLSVFWALCTYSMLRQDEEATPARLAKDLVKMLRAGRTGRFVMARAMVEYFRPGFHPDDDDNYAMARDYLAQLDAKLARA